MPSTFELGMAARLRFCLAAKITTGELAERYGYVNRKFFELGLQTRGDVELRLGQYIEQVSPLT